MKDLCLAACDLFTALWTHAINQLHGGPRPLILDLTASTVEANSLRHREGDAAIATVLGHKQTARWTDALCDQGFSCSNGDNSKDNLMVLKLRFEF